ncbi:MAG TPA: hypothetical protein VKE69_13805, partial [Planctomycetota bacterium]|nr:hypothetical protein [Planctomycetota bacterium]
MPTRPDSAARARRPKEPAPLLPILVLVAAVLGGALVRWPEASAVRPQSVAATPLARETLEAADAFRAGQGLTVDDGGVRRPTAAAPAMVLEMAVARWIDGSPAGPLRAQAAVSSVSIVLAALAGLAAAGWWGGAGAALLLAASPEQIAATRALSTIPTATFALAAAALAAVLAFRPAKPLVAGALAAGVVAGLGTAVDPVLALAGAGLVAAAAASGSGGALVGALVGLVVGWSPVAAHRVAAFGSPFLASD